MNIAQRAASSSVNFVRTHKLPIAIVATAITTAVIVKKTIGNQLADATEFLEQEGLLEKFYATFDENI